MTLIPAKQVLGTTRYGTYANRPAAGNIGCRYIASDGRVEFVDDGSVWRPLISGVPGTQPGLVASFTTLGASWTFADQTGGIVATSATNARLSALVVAKPAAVTTVAHVRWAANGSSAATSPPGIGIAVRDSAGGKLTTYFFYVETVAGPPTLFSEVDHWTNLTTASATAKAQTAVLGYNNGGLWLRFRDDGATTHFFDYSSNGVDWVTWFSESRTAFVPSGGNQVGWGLDSGSTSVAASGNLVSFLSQ